MSRALFVTLAVLTVLAGVRPLAAQRSVHRLDVSGTIDMGLAPYVARGVAEAEAAGAVALLVDLDTPGGRIDAAEQIVDALRGTEIPVYAFVNPRAFSAGAMIALAADRIYMTPAGVIGAATPVDGAGNVAGEKLISAMRAEFRALADARGLDPAVAEAMVDPRIEIPGVVKAGELLTLSASEARRLGYADGVVGNEAALLSEIGHAGATVVTAAPNWAENVVRFLTNPLVAPLLLSLGMLGLVIEVKTGAFGLGGLVSLGALGLFFGSHLLLGLAGWEEVLLLSLGLIALAVEIFVIPGFGVAGFLGVGLVGVSVVLAMIGAAPAANEILQALAILSASVIIVIAVSYAWLRHLPNSTRYQGLFLMDTLSRAGGYTSAPDRGDLVGQEGTALTDLRPAGTAAIADERVDVVSEGDYIARGSRVQVVRTEGYRHIVRPVV
jgi:membrane-bound serine protease (ClpP class)